MENIKKNLSTNKLLDIAAKNKDNVLIKDGPLCTYTGDSTGRSPNAKQIVYDEFTSQLVDWTNNKKMSEKEFSKLYNDFLLFKDSEMLYSQDVYAVRDPSYKIGFKIYTQFAKHSLFVRNMFIPAGMSNFIKKWEILQFPSLKKEPVVAISEKFMTPPVVELEYMVIPCSPLPLPITRRLPEL